MGAAIDRDDFDEDDYARFGERLEQCLEALGVLLERPGFGEGPATIGAELELFLVDGQGRPLPENKAVLDATADDRVTVEIGKFNLELNPDPTTLAGQPFGTLEKQMGEVLGTVARAAETCGGRVAMIGILPTLREQDLRRDAITDSPRYRAITKGLMRLRQEPFRIQIQGDAEPLEMVRSHPAMEGACTSFQVHLRVEPARFNDVYNAAQLVTAPVLACAVNSPFLLGHELWDETRVALFEQSADDRGEEAKERLVPRVAVGTGWLSGGPLQLFEEGVRLHGPVLPVLGDESDPVGVARAGGLPDLTELRLHQSTVWRWNRSVYDAGHGGHVRVEMRALPAGPTVVDMLANAAFLLGCTLALGPKMEAWTRAMPFARTHRNFFRAARHGLDAELDWLVGPDREAATIPAGTLCRRLLPEAAAALDRAGVDRGEIDRLLGVIEARLATRQTGAAWQRGMVAALEPDLGRDLALARMLAHYQELVSSGEPVHTWSIGTAKRHRR
jgi:Glutamate-cysteine ligase family 2(GCS2)